ncbi:MAG: glycosyltransferase family 39 protein [Flavobacteriales bacterium]|nr:glycosyltransferase family 39 protein [Flavobacteriales bacterium]
MRQLIDRTGSTWLFVAGFIILCSAFEYGRVMNLRPFPHHLSRQTAALSFTYTYWLDGNDFFEPELQHLAADGLSSGRTVAECPILYYLVAKLWYFTGPSEFAYRALMLILHFLASLALFRTLERVLGHGGWAALVSLFFFTSPAVVYFAISFMPDVPAFDLMLLGLAALFRRWPERSVSGFVWAAVFFTLAGLLKLPALMAPLTLLILLLAETAIPRHFSGSKPFFEHKVVAALLLGGILLVNFAWYSWSKNYVDSHGFPFSHSGTWAFWDLTPEQVDKAVQSGLGVTVWQLFDTPAWIMLGSMLFFLVVHFKRLELSEWLVLFSLFAGVALFTMLWFITLDAHEYYFIIPLLLPIYIVALFLRTLKSTYPKIFTSRWAIGAFVVLIGYHAVYASNNHRMRTRSNGPFVPEHYLPLYHPDEAFFWDMAQYWSMVPCLRMEPYLTSIGIEQEDKIIIANDRTVCAGLYLLNRKGWVDFGMDPFNAAALDARILQGARYFMYQENYWTPEPWLLPYLGLQVGQFEGMRIFDLHADEGAVVQEGYKLNE